MPETPATPGRLVSFWERTADALHTAPLAEDITADVCVVGAGMAGMMTAYLLAKEGRTVAVLADGPVGGGMTSRTTAHIVNALDDRYYDIESFHGEEGARLAAESHSAAIEKLAEIVAAERIVCDFERVEGYLFLPAGDDDKYLQREFEAAQRAGLTQVGRVASAPLEDFDTGPALLFPRQAQFHPTRFLHGLAQAIQRLGGRIFTGSHVTKIEGGYAARVETKEGHAVTAKAVVVATNTPINDRFAIHTKQAPYASYVVAFRVRRAAIPSILLWDTAQTAAEEKSLGPAPYHYARLARDGDDDVLIVGGEDHKTGQADDGAERFARLEEWTRARFPAAREVTDRWSGQVMEPTDAMAFIGRNPGDERNVFIATGDSGNGITHGVIAGILLTDLITGRTNPWVTLYDPSRKMVKPKLIAEFAKENLNVAAQMRDWLSGGDVASADDIARGDGAVLRRGLTKVAAYRDEAGTLHERSAVCPHLKCIVRWNGAEKTWDCPCHGSRFDCKGVVMNGPSRADLPMVESAV